MNQLQLVFFLALTYTGEDLNEKESTLVKLMEECKKETSGENVKVFYPFQFARTKTEACLSTCFYKKVGLMNDDNTINLDKELGRFSNMEKIDKEIHGKLVVILKDCHAKYTPTKKCDSIKTYTDCILKSLIKAGIIRGE